MFSSLHFFLGRERRGEGERKRDNKRKRKGVIAKAIWFHLQLGLLYSYSLQYKNLWLCFCNRFCPDCFPCVTRFLPVSVIPCSWDNSVCHMKKRCFKSCDIVKWLQHMVSAGSSLAFKQAPAEGAAAVQCHNLSPALMPSICWMQLGSKSSITSG